jgi:hypothetical protein
MINLKSVVHTTFVKRFIHERNRVVFEGDRISEGEIIS